jgi:hypothetical protein
MEQMSHFGWLGGVSGVIEIVQFFFQAAQMAVPRLEPRI